MKIGIYDPYLDTLGGGEKYMLTIAQCLASDHDVSVFWDHPGDINQASQRFSLDLSNVSLAKNVFINTSILKRANTIRKYDALFVLSDGSIPLVSAKRMFIHFQFPVEWVQVNRISKFKLKNIDHIFCNSEYTRHYIEKKFSVNSSVIYPPVQMVTSVKKKENIILTVGRYSVPNGASHDFKKQEILLEVFKGMVDDGLSNWKFVIIGGVRPEFEERMRLLKDRYQSYPVEFIMNSSRETLWDYYARSSIYWHASGYSEDLIHYPEKAEHFGISTVEAMSAGVVPVVINAGGQVEIVKHTTTGMVWNTLDELKAYTIQLVKQPELRHTMSLQSREAAKLYSEDVFCERIKRLLIS